MLFFIGALLIGIIVISLIFGLLNNRGDKMDGTDMTKEEFMRCLNFMLQHNIIDYTQYNDILVKGISFTKK